MDASACALLSEDYTATTRWHFQRELVTVHSGAAARQPSAGVALVAAAAGRACVALHPTTDAEALQAALREVEPAGEACLEAALKLALVGAGWGPPCVRRCVHRCMRRWIVCNSYSCATHLPHCQLPLTCPGAAPPAWLQLVSRRFPEGKTHVTAFVASGGAASSLAQHAGAAAELRRRFAEAAVSLDVAVLCTREELGAECAAALEALASGEAADASSSCGGEREGTAPAAPSSARLLWLTPVDAAAESWQQLEPALEQLESRGRPSSIDGSSSSASGSSGTSGGARSALPARISRAPRQNPRTSLLAARSGVQQPALCRGESLNRFGHLSSDGMARPWLPTYSSLGQAAKGAAAAAAAGAGAPAGVLQRLRGLACALAPSALLQGQRWLAALLIAVVSSPSLPCAPSCRNVLCGGAAAAALAHPDQGGCRPHAGGARRRRGRQQARQRQLRGSLLAAVAIPGGPQRA